MWTNQRLSLMENASTDCEQKASSGVCLISVCVTVCTQCVCVCVAWSASRNNCANTAAHAPPQRPVRCPARRERARAQVVSSPPAVLLSWTRPGQLESPPHTGASILLCFSDPSGRRERPLTGAMITRQLSSRFSRLEDHGLIGHLRQRLVLSSHPLADSC